MSYVYKKKKKKVHGLGWKRGGTDSSADSLTVPDAPSTPWLTELFFFPFQRSEIEPRPSRMLAKPPTTELHLPGVAFTITCCFYVSTFYINNI